MKWLYSFLAFVAVSIFISAFTMNIFLNTSIDNFDIAKQSFRDKTEVIVNASLEKSFSAMSPTQKAQLDQLDKLTASQRSIVLGPQCKNPQFEDQAFCDPDFVSGKMSLVEALREEAIIGVEKSQDESLAVLKDKFVSYTKYPLVLISIVGFILGAVFYILANGIFGGFQTFSGNISWLSFLSAISFKFMRGTIEKLLSVAVPPGADPVMLELTKQVMFDWLTPSMMAAFWISIWFAVGFGLLWLTFKFLRSYDVGFEQN